MHDMNNKAIFLPNRPLGKDLLDGQSQEYVAQAIKKHIEEVDAPDNDGKVLPRIIGVEGSWGSGKSNMLLQLKDKLKANYHFFTYDAWGNQEDLQRRSILEQLTDELITEELLVKETEITVLDTDLDKEPTPVKCSWKRRLFTLVARKSTTHDVTIPKMESSTKAFVLMLVVSAIVPMVLDTLKPDSAPWWYMIITIVGSLIPFLVFLICMCVKGWTWKDMWKMYQTEGRTDSATYTISELEPSVTEFRKWLNDLASSLEEGQHLVIVFDNMDRLPKDKVRQLWSSIQTFFAGNEENKVWCIIPFDREHLANAFADEGGTLENKIKLTNYFIEKTFPVVYRIPDPIITDYRGVFSTLFEMAFGTREELDLINRCYRLKYPKPNMREMISFINKCVSQCHTWGDEIRLTTIALFELNYNIIFDGGTPDDAIVNGKYMNGFDSIIENDAELPVEMSSLVYGVKKEKSASLPLKNVMSNELASKEPSHYAQYAKEQSEFYVILDEVISGMDATHLDNAINHIASISDDGISEKNKRLLTRIWNKLGKAYLSRTQNENDFRNEVRTLMGNCTIKAFKERIGRKFLELFTQGEKNGHKGDEWFKVYKSFKAFIKESGLEVELPERKMKAGDFFDYLKAALDEYKNYPVVCDNGDLNKAAISWITEGIDVSLMLQLLTNDERYDFSDLLREAKKMIVEEKCTDDNIEPVLKVCKALSKKPWDIMANVNYLDTLSHEGDVLYDLQILRAIGGKEIPGENDAYYAEMAKVAYNYVVTYYLWDKTHSYGTQVLAKVMGWLIANNKHIGTTEKITDVITGMANIESRTGAKKEDIIRFVNDWGRTTLNETEKKVTLANVFGQESWCKALMEVGNPLSEAILNKYYADFNAQVVTVFINGGWAAQNNSYWLRNLKVLIDGDAFKAACREKLVEITNALIESICNNQIVAGSPNIDLQEKLLSWAKFGDVSSKVNNMMSRFGTGQLQINAFKFKSLHHFMEKTAGYETQYLNNVLKPVVSDEEIQGIIAENVEFYESLIRNHLEQASDLKVGLVKLYGGTGNAAMKEMIDRLGIIEKDKK